MSKKWGKAPDLTEIVTETTRGTSALKVDRERGIIFRAKIAGKKSANGYTYGDGVYEAAKAMYEGCNVNADHGAKPGVGRSIRDRFGWFENVVIEGGEPFGDFHLFNTKTELAQTVMNAAEHKPDAFGFSHVAKVRWRSPKKDVAESILQVASVDLVADGATTSSIFEQRNQPVSHQITVREWLQALPAGSLPAKLVSVVCEDAAMGGAMMDAPASTDPDQALKDGFASAMKAAVDAYLSGDLDSAGMIAKLKDLTKMLDKATGSAAAAPAATPPADTTTTQASKKPEPPSTDPAVSQLQEQLQAMQRKDLARSLCDAEEVKPSAAMLKALVALGAEADMKELIQESKAAKPINDAAKTTPAVKPKSGQQGATSTVQEGKTADSFEAFCKQALGRAPAIAGAK